MEMEVKKFNFFTAHLGGAGPWSSFSNSLLAGRARCRRRWPDSESKIEATMPVLWHDKLRQSMPNSIQTNI